MVGGLLRRCAFASQCEVCVECHQRYASSGVRSDVGVAACVSVRGELRLRRPRRRNKRVLQDACAEKCSLDFPAGRPLRCPRIMQNDAIQTDGGSTDAGRHSPHSTETLRKTSGCSQVEEA